MPPPFPSDESLGYCHSCLVSKTGLAWSIFDDDQFGGGVVVSAAVQIYPLFLYFKIVWHNLHSLPLFKNDKLPVITIFTSPVNFASNTQISQSGCPGSPVGLRKLTSCRNNSPCFWDMITLQLIGTQLSFLCQISIFGNGSLSNRHAPKTYETPFLTLNVNSLR